jgi:hypothetical protein
MSGPLLMLDYMILKTRLHVLNTILFLIGLSRSSGQRLHAGC